MQQTELTSNIIYIYITKELMAQNNIAIELLKSPRNPAQQMKKMEGLC